MNSKGLVFIATDSIISSLGFGTSENIRALSSNNCGIKEINKEEYSTFPLFAGEVSQEQLVENFSLHSNPKFYTKLESMMILSISNVITGSNLQIGDKKTALIISSTKGNISLLKNVPNNIDKERVYLWKMANEIAEYFNFPEKPLIISNACTSGLLAVIWGVDLIRSGKYDNIIVCGGDALSEFVVSGFQSLKALASENCRPFDADRDGLNLGEASGAILLTSNRNLINSDQLIYYQSGATSNDANHISGPSRTGEGLLACINKVLKNTEPPDYISAHGTATVYNDNMESEAVFRAGLGGVPVNSFKGYWGHTLGAAGIIELIAGFASMRNNVVYASAGFESLGTSKDINVIKSNTNIEINTFMKLASGFGGTNAAALFKMGIFN